MIYSSKFLIHNYNLLLIGRSTELNYSLIRQPNKWKCIAKAFIYSSTAKKRRDGKYLRGSLSTSSVVGRASDEGGGGPSSTTEVEEVEEEERGMMMGLDWCLMRIFAEL